MTVVSLIFLSLASQQAVTEYTLDLYYRSTWIGESKTRIERTKLRDQSVIKTTRTTHVTTSYGRVKPMFTELIQYQTEEGSNIELRYTCSSGLEAQEMTVTWKGDNVEIIRRGMGSSGAYEPVKEIVPLEKAKQVGGSPLDSVLFGGTAKTSTTNLALNFETKKLEENQIRYVGEATLGREKTPVLEYHVIRKGAILYRVYLDSQTEIPLRIESLDGLLMIPKRIK
jgi:hypothetical protein